MNTSSSEAAPPSLPAVLSAPAAPEALRDAAAIMADLRALAGQDGLLSLASARQSSPVLVREARLQFGSWKSALAAAGVHRRLRWPPPREATLVIADLQAMSGPDGTISHRDLIARNAGLRSEARRRFGGWKAAMAAAGLSPASPWPPPRGADAIVADLRILALTAQNLHADPVRRSHPALVKEAVKRFGHWHHALTAAGLPLPRRRPLPREADLIIADLQALAANGQSMRPTRMEISHVTLYREARDRFGTWETALARAGLKLIPRRINDCTFTRESLLAKLSELAAVVKPLHQEKVMALPGCNSVGKWARRYFGTWSAALEAADLPVPPPSWQVHLPKHSPTLPDAAAVIAAIKARAAAGLPLLKKSLYANKAAGGNLHLDRAAKRIFGGWQAAVDAAGVADKNTPVVSRRFWKAEDVLTALRERHAAGLALAGRGLFDGPDRAPALYDAARRFFQSWRVALTAAGLPVTELRPAATAEARARSPLWAAARPVTVLRLPPFTQPAALQELLLRYRAGEPIAAKAVLTSSRMGRRLHDDLIRFFGSWKAALTAAGIPHEATRPPHPRHRFSSKEDILRALRERLAAGQPIDLATLNGGRARGGDTTLVQYAREYYRSWEDAMRDARTGEPSLLHPTTSRGAGGSASENVLP